MKKFDKDLAFELINAIAISGHEDEVRAILRREYNNLKLPIIYDNLGSLVALKKGNGKSPLKILVLSHMDEVGFAVKAINDKGLILVDPIGGINEDILPGQLVAAKDINQQLITGVFGARPPHLKNDKKEIRTIDFGFSSKEEAQKKMAINTPITFFSKPQIHNTRLMGKALDDRIGCLMGVELLRRLKDIVLPFDLYVGASTQEEVGLRGGQTIANVINPDCAFILDISPARDVELDADLGHLGKGVLIRMADATFILPPDLMKWQIDAAERAKVSYQFYISPGSTDSGVVLLTGAGIKVIPHCIAARYIHSALAVCELNDYHAALDTLEIMIQEVHDKISILSKEHL